MGSTSTPWGQSDGQKTLAEGVVYFSTASHGGVRLSSAQNGQIPAGAKRCDLRRRGWYEHDVHANIPILVFGLGNAAELAAAKQNLADWDPDAYRAIFGELPKVEDSRELQRREFEQRTRDQFVVVSAIGGPGRGVPAGQVGCWARRASDGAEVQVLVRADRYRGRGRFGFVLTEADMSQAWVERVESLEDAF